VKLIEENGIMTIRNITYKLYPGLHGKKLANAYDTTIKDIVRGRTNFNSLPVSIGWDSIRESRVTYGKQLKWDDLEEFYQWLDNFKERYSKDKIPCHKKVIECWFEKETVIDEFEEVCNKYSIPFLATRGQLTWTAKRKASERLGSDAIILYFGDNDPKGYEIFETIKRDLEYLGCGAEIIWAGVTQAQEKEYNLPEESRLDGFELKDLKKVIEGCIKNYIDLEVFKELCKKELEEKETLDRTSIRAVEEQD